MPIHACGDTFCRISSSTAPNIETPLIESGAYSGSEFRTHYGARLEAHAYDVEAEVPPPSYQEVMHGRFLEITQGEQGFEFEV